MTGVDGMKLAFLADTRIDIASAEGVVDGVMLTDTCILYKKDVVRRRNDYNEQVQKENNAKAVSYTHLDVYKRQHLV